MNTGLKEAEGILPPATITIDGVDYPGTYAELSATDAAIAGGFEEIATAEFLLRKSVYPQKPRSGEVYRVNGERRKAVDVTAAGSAWRITLEATQ